MADEKTTISASPELAPLDVRRANRQKAREEAMAQNEFSHAAELRAIAAAEVSGARGPMAQARRQTLGTAQEPLAPGDGEGAAGEGSAGGDDAGGGDGWGQGGQGSGGSSAAAGVTASAPKPGRRQRANA